MRIGSSVAFVVGAVAVAGGALGCASDSDPCDGVAGACVGVSSGASTEEVQTAMLEVADGGTIALGEGTFEMKSDLSLDVDNVTIVGKGLDKTVLSFAHQESGAQGILVTADNF